jgi:hypothetical protein
MSAELYAPLVSAKSGTEGTNIAAIATPARTRKGATDLIVIFFIPVEFSVVIKNYYM